MERRTITKRIALVRAYIIYPRSPTWIEVVSADSQRLVSSWTTNHRSRTYHDFCDATSCTTLLVACWTALLNSIGTRDMLRQVKIVLLILLGTLEVTILFARFRTHYSAGAVAPRTAGIEFGAEHRSRSDAVKRSLELLGTALFAWSVTRLLGLAVLGLTLPIVYESMRQATVRRTIYVYLPKQTPLDSKLIQFWRQAAALGSNLIVGIQDSKSSDLQNACCIGVIHQVMTEAPSKADVLFLEKYNIDYVVKTPGQTMFVTDEVVQNRRVLALGDDNVARLVEAKVESKKE